MAPAEILTVGGAAVVVGILTEVLKRVWKPTDEQLDRFGPFLSLVVALVIVVPTGILNGQDVIQSALTAILAGATAAGLYDLTTPVRS
jgi:hypothetical protein